MRNIVIGLILSGLVACTCAPPRPPDAGVDAGGGDASLDVGLELDGGGVDGGSSDAGIELDDGGFDGGVVDGGSSDAGPLARWTAVFPPGRRFHSLTWDGDLGRVVMFGGWVGNKAIADMWEWDGARWVERRHTVSPSARGLHGMAWDSGRHRLVLFGGIRLAQDVDGGTILVPFGDTWEHDGVTWVERFPLMAPSAREGHQMAYDSARQRVVLVGGNAGALSNETWEWDGTTWSRKASSPPTTFGTHGLAYDEARSRIVLLAPSGTWEWDGLTWLQKQSTTPPGGITTARLAWDPTRRRIILTGTVNDTWEWDGASWVAFAGTVPERRFHGMAFDQASGRMVVFGGMDPDSVFQADTWERDGSTWSQRAAPSRLWEWGQLAFDEARHRMITFGGLSKGPSFPPFPCTNGTWEWSGLDWVQRSPANSPPPLCWNSLAYDSARQRVVLFGGIDVTGTPTAETWEWDGADWTRRTPSTSPSARGQHAMAFDEARQRIVLFGGWNRTLALGDLWEWDGVNWVERLPAAPLPSRKAPMAYDRATQRMVILSGGTWEWDGTAWSGGGAAPAGVGAMAWDPIRERMVAFVNVPGTLDREIWERNGAVWFRRAMAPGGVPLGGNLEWDADQQRMMMSGSSTWFYEPGN